MPTNKKRSTRLTPEQFVAAAEALSSEIETTVSTWESHAKLLRDAHGQPRGAAAMMDDRKPYTREFAAWMVLDCMAQEGLRPRMVLGVETVEELSEKWDEIVAMREQRAAERCRLTQAVWIKRQADLLWREVAQEIARQKRAGKSMIEGDFDPWGSRSSAIEKLCQRSPNRAKFLLLRPLFQERFQRLAPAVRHHPTEAMAAWLEAEFELSISMFAAEAIARKVAAEQRKLVS